MRRRRSRSILGTFGSESTPEIAVPSYVRSPRRIFSNINRRHLSTIVAAFVHATNAGRSVCCDKRKAHQTESLPGPLNWTDCGYEYGMTPTSPVGPLTTVAEMKSTRVCWVCGICPGMTD